MRNLVCCWCFMWSGDLGRGRLGGEAVSMKTLGIIPAQHDSTRLPGKNWRDLCGKPLFMWTAEQCQKSERLTDWLVSTNSAQIRAECIRAGIPFAFQPDTGQNLGKLALHHASAGSWDAVAILQPTSPLRLPADIDAGISLLAGCPWAEAVVGYVDSKHTHTNGSLFIARLACLPRIPLDGPTVCRYLMPPERSVDIDTAWDFWLAGQAMNFWPPERLTTSPPLVYLEQ